MAAIRERRAPSEPGTLAPTEDEPRRAADPLRANDREHWPLLMVAGNQLRMNDVGTQSNLANTEVALPLLMQPR